MANGANKCKNCGQWVEWAVNSFGKNVPYDRTAGDLKLSVVIDGASYPVRTCHFDTCSNKQPYVKREQPAQPKYVPKEAAGSPDADDNIPF